MQMYLDVLLEHYANGDDYSEQLGSPVNADRVASEVVGKLRHGMLLQAVTIKTDDEGNETPSGVSYDGPMWQLLFDELTAIEKGERTDVVAVAASVVKTIFGQLKVAKNPADLKSKVKREIQVKQQAAFKPNGDVFALILGAARAAEQRRVNHHASK